MKKYMTILLALIAVSTGVNAQEALPRSYADFYTTFGCYTENFNFKDLIPSISFGKRSISEHGGGINFGATIAYLEKDSERDNYILMFPKIKYTHYGTVEFDGVNGYFGFGAAAAAYQLEGSRFKGILGIFTAGLDFFRDRTLNGFIQGEVSYPALSFFTKEGKDIFLFQAEVGLGF